MIPTEDDRRRDLKPEEIGKLFLRDLLTSALTGPSQETAGRRQLPTQADRSQISTGAKISNAFRMRLRLTSKLNDGRLVVGPYQGTEKTGYRIAYASGERPSFELLSVTEQGVRLIETSDKMINLEDGRPHTIEWRRSARGRMIVLADGNEIIRARDNDFRGDFDGFTVINAGGEYAVHRIRVVSRQFDQRVGR